MFRAARCRALWLLSTDAVIPFLADIGCPLAHDQVAVVRISVRSLASPLDEYGLKDVLLKLEGQLPSGQLESFRCWATFVCYPLIAPFMIWASYRGAFYSWAAGMRHGRDEMNLGPDSQRVFAAYERYDGRVRDVVGSDFQDQLRQARAEQSSKWDRFLEEQFPPIEQGDAPWDVLSHIEHSYDMVQFQDFVGEVRGQLAEMQRKNCEDYVRKFFSTSNPAPFLGLSDLPICRRTLT